VAKHEASVLWRGVTIRWIRAMKRGGKALQKGVGEEEQARKADRRDRSEKQPCPRKEADPCKRWLGSGQSEEGRQACRNPEEGEGDPLSRCGSSIASQPFIPCQAVMRTSGPRKRRRRRGFGGEESWFRLDFQMLAMQTQAGVPLMPSVPVAALGVEQIPLPADEAGCSRGRRFGCCAAVPLALLAASGHGQQSRMLDQDVACGTVQRSIRLEGKVGTREAAC
jgi:hypothetical protein